MQNGQEPSKLRAALSRYVEARSAAIAAARRELGIGEGDAKALLFVTDHPGVRAAEIASYLGITAAGATALIDRLVDRGAVRREYDAEDRRVIHIVPAVDLSQEPWSALSRFDDDFDRVLGTYDVSRTSDLASLLDELTTSTSSR